MNGNFGPATPKYEIVHYCPNEAVLTGEQRRRIVTLFATYHTPSEVLRLIFEEWPDLQGKITTRFLTRYNPTTNFGLERISDENLRLFEETRNAYEKEIASLAISSRRQRQGRRDREWRKLNDIVEERTEAYRHHPDPVLRSGLGITRTVPLGGGVTKEEVALDTPLLTALTDLEEAAATEMGHNKSSPSVIVQKAIIGIDLSKV